MVTSVISTFLFVLLFFACQPATGATFSSGNSSEPRPIELWPRGAPGATGNSDEDRPAIIPYLPSLRESTGAALLICPGGGFTTRATDHEGVLIAQWLKARGIAGFVLRYRIRPLYTTKESLLDARRGLQYIRSHAGEFHLSSRRIGIIGFSAGAELAAGVAFDPSAVDSNAADPVERVSSRPDFLVLAYGSTPFRRSADEGPGPIPPTFMFCTAEDAAHVAGMLDLYRDLLRAQVPAEAHLFSSGEHGVGFAQGDPVLGEWPDLMFNWIRTRSFLIDGTRVPIQGLVRIDGEPLPRGSVIMTPIDNPRAPSVIAYVFNTGPVRGQFSLDQEHGPVPGRYRVEVRQDATRWLSNARNPVIAKMSAKEKSGKLTEQDRLEWDAYARNRDLSPSIEDQRVFRHRRPGGKEELTIEVSAGGEKQFTIDVFSR